MKQKEKGKFNPFIRTLHPDEEILWFSMQPPMPFWNHLIGFILRSLVTILFMACFFGIFLTMLDFSSTIARVGDAMLARLLGNIWGSLVVIVIPMSLPLMVVFYVYSWRDNTRKLRDAYAVTNQRLLVYSQQRRYIQTRPLEDIEELRMHTRAVAFVQTFAQAHDVEEVVHLIEATQNQLLTQQKLRHEGMLADDPIAFENENLLRQAKG